jgi:hypothetical protein
MKIHSAHSSARAAHDDPRECDQAEKIESIEREIGDLNKAVFRGNGKPSLISQVAVMDSKINAICWLVTATCGAVIVQLVVLFFRLIGKI